MFRVVAPALALVCALFGPVLGAVVHAQPSSAAAEALFRAGRVAAQKGDAQTSCAKFRESYRLDAAVGTLLNIAICEVALGELSTAWQHFQEVLHALPAGDERVALTQEHLQKLDARLPRLTVRRASSAPAETRLLLGSVELGEASFDVELPLDPGKYQLQASAPGREPRSYELQVQEGDRLSLEVEPGAASALPAAVAAPSANAITIAPSSIESKPVVAVANSDTNAEPRRTLAYALLVTGGASLLTSGVLAGLVIDRAATVDDHCDDDTKGCDPTGDAAVSSGKTLYVATLITLAVGLVSAGSGAVLLLTERSASETQLTFAPRVSASGAQLHAALRF